MRMQILSATVRGMAAFSGKRWFKRRHAPFYHKFRFVNKLFSCEPKIIVCCAIRPSKCNERKVKGMDADVLFERIGEISELFANAIDDTKRDWDGAPGPYILMSSICHCIADNISKLNKQELKTVFDIIEDLLESDNDSTKDLVCTSFLENLQNLASTGKFDFRTVAGNLGRESIAFCKAWDNFTGVKTDGIY